MELKHSVKEKIISAKSVYKIITELLNGEDELDREKEHLWSIGLNNQNQIKYIDLVHLGAINSCPFHPMEIYRRACIKGNASLIVAHNHPSGNPAPSSEDRAMTKRLKEGGDILGIKFLDHVIVGDEGYFSFSESGES
jgi:DNA repair protein RadC